MGVLTSAPGRPGAGMEWRVTIELNGADGTKQTHEVARGGGTDPHSTLDPLGLTLDDGKTLLAGVQRHLVQARVAEYSALRRHCSHCRGLRPLKDTRTRRLNSLFGTVEVPAPRFKPCRCAVAARSTFARHQNSCQTAAPPNTSGHWRRWGPGCHIAAPGGFCPSSSRSVLTLHGTRRSAAGPRGLGRVSNGKPCRGRNRSGRRRRRKR